LQAATPGVRLVLGVLPNTILWHDYREHTHGSWHLQITD